ncbi:PIN domain-containing protein [Achromobacter xylosoxidans]|uniref:PIN domain-containing protein n=1 Tax=Alcaligenes xylosoxydans xylosoxydans TaxID=85698 RepID=UPI001F1460E5|nr:PIN domain-containing protein [Achromobacter xylosoxidans]
MKQMTRKVNLHIVFDTNVVWSDSILDVFNNATVSLIRQHSGHQDLSVSWLLPRIARQEREYQMRRKAFAHLPAVQKLESLVGFHWGVDEAKISDTLSRRIDDELKALGVREIKIDPTATDWELIMSNSANRVAPFEHKDNSEKGFRDAVVCETLRQVLCSVNGSDQVFFVCRDELLRDAAVKAMASTGHPKSRCIQSLDDLTTEINVLASKIPDEFAQRLVDLGARYFLNEQSGDGLFYTAGVRSMIEKEFGSTISQQLERFDAPSETVSVSKPVFRQKKHQTVYFTSSVTLTFQETSPNKAPESTTSYQFQPSYTLLRLLNEHPAKFKNELKLYDELKSYANHASPDRSTYDTWRMLLLGQSRVSFEVEWSVSVNRREQLSRAKVERILASPDS